MPKVKSIKEGGYQAPKGDKPPLPKGHTGTSQPLKTVAGIVIIPDKGEIHTYSTADGLGKIKYRKLNSASMGSLRGTLKIDPRTEEPDEGELQVSVLAKAIVSWEGFIDEQGKPVPVTPEYIRSLPYLVFNELFLKVMPEVGSTSSPLPRSKRT